MDFNLNEPEFVRSKYGAKIKKCCASCIHKNPMSEFRRLCDCGGGIVKPSDCCDEWEMIPKLDNAGRGDGSIHSLHYLNYVRDYEQPKNPPFVSVKEIAREYEEEFGSRYYIKR